MCSNLGFRCPANVSFMEHHWTHWPTPCLSFSHPSRVPSAWRTKILHWPMHEVFNHSARVSSIWWPHSPPACTQFSFHCPASHCAEYPEISPTCTHLSFNYLSRAPYVCRAQGSHWSIPASDLAQFSFSYPTRIAPAWSASWAPAYASHSSNLPTEVIMHTQSTQGIAMYKTISSSLGDIAVLLNT